jgi:SNF2 family DNA or RNA helicase
MTPHQCKYIAHDLTRKTVDGQDRLSMSLFNAAVDLNPHQIEAALFALQSPLSQGCILADEVGLGKTIEAGIVICQYWAERRRKIVIITPASIRKQWALELEEKFNLPAVILDSQSWKDALKEARWPLDPSAIVLMSFNFACRVKEELRSISWDLVVIDEAHKLRNAYRASNKVGQAIRWATECCRKLLLTATPLQNSLLELYGLSTLIDDNLFGDVNAFRAQYLGAEANLKELRSRLHSFCTRTLRKQVLEYINYTERKAITRPFSPSEDEQFLYEAVSAFLQRENSFAIPGNNKQLTQIILRKLLASSSTAIAGTLATMKARLERIRDSWLHEDDEGLGFLFPDEEIEDELLDEILEEPVTTTEASTIDRKALQEEIHELDRLMRCAEGIGVDTKSRSLLSALEIGFSAMAETGAARKALIFTESRRTQDYLATFLKEHGFTGKFVLFNGSNASPEATAIYQRWLVTNKASGRASGSRDIDIRTALVEYFRDHADIMIATEAAAEGINLQFCSLVVNYDLPWNPQRVEQRIGRCHRYGQKHDVVVINFLNERNEADRRVLELLGEKFRLFSGVFGASDEVLGSIESGVDFEKRILAIYQGCRTPDEIDAAFAALQAEMDEAIKSRLDVTRTLLLENFDEDVHDRLRIRLEATRIQLDRFSKRFWALTKEILHGKAVRTRAATEERPATRDLSSHRQEC